MTGKTDLPEDWLVRARREEYHLTSAWPIDARVNRHRRPTLPEIDVHAGVEVGVVLRGQQERFHEDLAITVDPGGVWLCAMWEPHGWCATAADTAEVVLIFLPEFLGEETFGTASWLSLFAAPPKARPRVSSPATRRAVLAIGEELAAEVIRQPVGWRSAVRCNLLRLLLLLYRQWDPPPESAVQVPGHSNKLARMMPALALLHRRPGFRVSVEEAAAACALSPSQFTRLFGQTMGMSFGRFRLRARLGLVAHRLLTTDLPTDDIAEEAGFVHASHLHRAFVKRYGCTPAAYRRRAG